MDSTTEKGCLDEISTLVLDCNEKVTLKSLSNNWSITNAEASKVLLKWLDQNAKKAKDLKQEFLVSGINETSGVFSVSIVPEAKKAALEKKWKNFRSTIYSLDTKSNLRSLDLPDYEPIKVKRILLTQESVRDLAIPEIPVIKSEPTTSKPSKPKTPFSVMKPVAVKKENKKPEVESKTKVSPKAAEVKPEVKKEKPVKVDETPEKVAESPKESPKEVKVEKKSPEDSKAAGKAPAAKKGVKNQKQVSGKASISSFFSNKPSTSKAATDKPKPAEVVKAELIDIDEDEEMPEEKPKSPEKPKSKPAKKTAKVIKLKELQKNNKRSRIRVMADSSEEDEAENSDHDEPTSKLIKFDREMTPDCPTKPLTDDTPDKNKHYDDSPVKESSESKPAASQNKHKAKRWVTKRYQTEDGFMRSERVQEEYSASEDENDENKKKNSPPAGEKKAPAATRSAEKKSTVKKSPASKKSPAPKTKPAAAKGKQGNITSFFTRK